MLRSREKKTTVFDYVKTISTLCRDNRESVVLPLQCMMRPQSSSQTCMWYIYINIITIVIIIIILIIITIILLIIIVILIPMTPPSARL